MHTTIKPAEGCNSRRAPPYLLKSFMTERLTETGNALLPERIRTQDELDLLLSRPTDRLVRSIREFSSPLVILGAGGKLGPTLAVMAKRAAEQVGYDLEVIAVSRFNNSTSIPDWLHARGVTTLSCDLLQAEPVRRLPDSKNVIHLVGQKFRHR